MLEHHGNPVITGQKRIITLLSILLMFSLSLYAQNSAPVVENVTFSQRTDVSFIVDIYCTEKIEAEND